ncbi:MAG: flippase [bacterium]
MISANIRKLKNRINPHFLEVVQGSTIAFSLKILGTILAFAFNLLVARKLGAEGTGIYFLAITITTIAAVIGRIGLDTTLLRFTAANAAIRNWQAVKGLYKKGLIYSISISFLIALLMCLTAPVVTSKIFSKPELIAPIRYLAIAVVPLVILTLHAELLKGLKLIFASQVVQSLGVPAISLIALILIRHQLVVEDAVWAYILAVIVTALFSVWLWRKATPQMRNIMGSFETNQLFSSCMPIFLMAILDLAMVKSATVLLGIWKNNADVGIFNVASQTSRLISFVLFSVNSIAAPKFAALYRQGNKKVLQSTARSSTKIMTILASPLLLFIVFMPNRIMGLFGKEFAEGSIVLIILALGQYVNVITGSVGYLLTMSGNERTMRNNVIVGSGVNILLNLLLIPTFGMIGAALATSISIATINILASISVYKILGIQVFTVCYVSTRIRSQVY